MTTANQITPGMTLNIDGKIFRVESSVKVTVAKGTPFVKTKLRNLVTEEVIERNFKLDQMIQEVSLIERTLEFLYPEGKEYLFLDIGNLENVLVPASILAEKVNYLREGIAVKAMFYGDTIFSIELPQFLEIMVVKTEGAAAGTTKKGVLETGAKVDVPLFIESGDVIKVDTHIGEYVKGYNMEIEQIKELIGYLEQSKLSKLVFKKGDMEIRLEKESEVRSVPVSRALQGEIASEGAFQSDAALHGERGGLSRQEPQVVSGAFVTSPMVGTFYASAAPDQPAFVKVGDKVNEQTVVCIIEAMKVMNEVKAGVSGTVDEVLADNAQPVEFGTRLLRIKQ